MSPLTKSLVRNHIAQGVEMAHQLAQHSDPSDPDRQMAEANLALLQHLVDPEVSVLFINNTYDRARHLKGLLKTSKNSRYLGMF